MTGKAVINLSFSPALSKSRRETTMRKHICKDILGKGTTAQVSALYKEGPNFKSWASPFKRPPGESVGEKIETFTD